MNRHECVGCQYYRVFSRSEPKTKCCHFCFDTDEPRGCDPGTGCTRYTAGTRAKREYTLNITHEFVPYDQYGKYAAF